jgi:hypothetical protein
MGPLALLVIIRILIGMTTRYYRIQPAGLELSGHRSLSSNDETPFGVDVFELPWQAAFPEGPLDSYGDEVVVIETDEDCWDNGDAEGCRIDPEGAWIVARFPVAKWVAAWDVPDCDDVDVVAEVLSGLGL